MRVSARCVAPSYWVPVAILLVIAVAGVTADAAPVRFVGTLTFEGVPPLNFVVLLEPGQGATYSATFLGFPIDSGVIVATQSGSAVAGAMQSLVLRSRPCGFSAFVSGARVDGVLDPASCGGPGTFVLTRA